MKGFNLLMVLIGIFLSVVVISWLSLSVPGHPSRNKTTPYSGIVTGLVYYPGTKDIQLNIGNDDGIHYYINRGMQYADTALLNSCLNKQVTVYWYSGGFDIFGQRSSRHICELILDDEIVYTEILSDN